MQQRVNRMWQNRANFGLERNAYRVYLDEFVTDR